jgi:2,3-bisphosphoglycerate-independent phosphoglycerate mutase
MDPGSDTANMSLLGVDPAKYHTGRSPIEAAAMGVELGDDDIAFRCNLVTLGRRDGSVIMDDYCAGHIDTDTAAQFIEALNQALKRPGFEFHPGVGYRHLLVWKNGPAGAATTPPHDHTGQAVDDWLVSEGELGAASQAIRDSWQVLGNHPLNQRRREKGEPEVNSIWLWGQGPKTTLPQIGQRFGLSGFTVSAVDLIHGLGVLSGLTPVEVPGATGYLDTNFAGKVQAVLEGLRDKDLAFLHVEAPDEAGHGGVLANKLKAIELFDREVAGPVLEGLAALGPHRVLLATDHYTPLKVRTHTTEPIPYVIWDSRRQGPGGEAYSEAAAAAVSKGPVAPAHELLGRLAE